MRLPRRFCRALGGDHLRFRTLNDALRCTNLGHIPSFTLDAGSSGRAFGMVPSSDPTARDRPAQDTARATTAGGFWTRVADPETVAAVGLRRRGEAGARQEVRDLARRDAVSRKMVHLGAGIAASAALLLLSVRWHWSVGTVAVVGVLTGVSLTVCGSGALAWAVLGRADRRRAALWAERTQHRSGGALWTRAPLPQVDELAGWKVARIVGESSPHFVGLAFGRYRPNETATCVHHDHEAPQPDCTCGFYAFRTPWRARWAWSRSRDGALLRVEGFGRAVEHELGWRARRQEILTVFLARRCRHCWRGTEGLARVPLFNEWTPSCQRCATRRGREFLTPSDLANDWGTEVRIADQFRWGFRAPR